MYDKTRMGSIFSYLFNVYDMDNQQQKRITNQVKKHKIRNTTGNINQRQNRKEVERLRNEMRNADDMNKVLEILIYLKQYGDESHNDRFNVYEKYAERIKEMPRGKNKNNLKKKFKAIYGVYPEKVLTE